MLSQLQNILLMPRTEIHLIIIIIINILIRHNITEAIMNDENSN